MRSTVFVWIMLVSVMAVTLIILIIRSKKCNVHNLIRKIHGVIGIEHYDMFYDDEDE